MAVILDTPWVGLTFDPPTPLDIGTIETAIVNQLTSQINTIEIRHYPDKPETYRLTHRIGAGLVRFDGAAYGELIDTAAVVQKRTLRFAIKLMMRDLGWSLGGEASGPSPGAYALLEAMRQALTGFLIGGCTKMYPVSERFVERDKEGGVWIYESVFALTTAAVEPGTIDNFPLLLKAIAQEANGQTTRISASAQYSFGSTGEIQLAFGNISNVVVTSVPNGFTYTADIDYAIDAVNGLITWLPEGSIPPSATVSIVYNYGEVVIALAGGGSAPTAPTN